MNKYLIILLIFSTSCELFQTRNPEEPDNKQSSYLPPTSPENIFANFQNSFIEKNADNYKNCFYISQLNEKYSYQPSSETLLQFGTFFENWDNNSEKRYFQSLTNNLSIETGINLKMDYSQNISYPDSIVASGTYSIAFKTGLEYKDNYFAGKFQFTLRQDNQNYWYIYRWIDFATKDADTLQASWSSMKISYGN